MVVGSRVVGSRLYSPYRAIGYITDGVPFAINRLGDATFITTTVGNAFQVFEHERLRISLVSPPQIAGGPVVALAAQGSRTYVATEKGIQVWERVSLKATLDREPRGRLTSLLLVGDVLMAIDDTGLLRIWDAKSHEFQGEVELGGDHQFGACMIHPHTYLNKILVGDSGGRLSLWNIRSRKLVHHLQHGGAAVTALEASPAIDVVAVGRADGIIQLVNVRFDKVLFSVRQDNVAVTSLAFRTDVGSQETPMMASGGQDGQIHVWDLKTHRLHSTLHAHDASVSSLSFFPREPIMLSSSRDNSLKMWIFDGADGTARLHKSREGHTAPPRRIRYYGSHTLASMGTGADATGCQILSAGSDRSFRIFNTARDSQSRELSQGPLLKKARKLNVKVEELKLKPIMGFSAVETRSRDWANVITCHEEDSQAYVWKFDQRVIAQVVLRQPDWPTNDMMTPDIPAHHALCVTVTNCGNYGLVGTRGGVVYMYNMQSGEARGAFPQTQSAVSRPHESVTLDGKKARPGSVWAAFKTIIGNPSSNKKRPRSEDKKQQKQMVVVEQQREGHQGPVTGVEVDSLNSVVMSASLDGTIRFWDFKRRCQEGVVEVGVGVSLLELARDSDLLAAACDDFVVRVYDVTTRKLVRRLTGHTAHLTDMSFSRDGRRLVTASVDASLRVWDLPTGACVDWLSFKRAVTGVTMSPTGEYLCTSHVDSLSLNLWADRSLYTSVSLDGPVIEPFKMDDPRALSETEDAGASLPDLLPSTEPGSALIVSSSTTGASEKEEAEVTKRSESLTPKSEGLITLSMLPKAHWQTLFHLELIKQRNRPKEPPKAPPRAPFFLPTLHVDGQVEPTFAPALPPPPPPVAAAAAAEGVNGGGEGEDVDEDLAEFAALAQAWSDDDDEEGAAADGTQQQNGGGNDNEEEDEGRGWVLDRKPKQVVSLSKSGGQVIAAALNSSNMPTSGSRILRTARGKDGVRVTAKPSRSALARLLLSEDEKTGWEEAVTGHLLALAPPQIDLEMQALCLGVEDDEGLLVLRRALRYFRWEIRHRRHFEAIQSYLHRLLHIYSPVIVQVPGLRKEVAALRDTQADANRQIKELIQHNACLLGYLSNLHGF